ncbi:MAG: FkbM family methyltransferase [Patulibacter sp.]
MTSRLRSHLRLLPIRARKAVALARTPSHWRAARAGVVAAVEHRKVPLGGPYATVLDVGASRGQFALHATQRYPDARVLCFEPLRTSQDVLRRVLGSRVTIVPTAVGAEPGTAVLHVAAADDSSSLLPIGTRQRTEFPGTHETGRIEVPVTPLSEFLGADLAQPALLKIDVQGLELEVLRGAGDALSRVDTVLVECSFVELYEGQALADDVIVHMAQRGFRLAGVYGLATAQNGEALQSDLLFRNLSSV